MNKHLNLTVLSLSLSGLLLTSCTKEPSTENSNSTKVKSEILYDDDGSRKDSVAYTYDGNKVTKAEIIGDDNMHFTFEYSGEKVVKKNYFTSSSTLSTEYDKINYNANGTISSVEHYIKSSTSDVKVEVRDLTYNNGKLSKLVFSEVSNGTADIINQMEFTYTNGNITSEKITDAISPNDPETITFTYDNNGNYSKNLFSQPAIIDPVFDLSDEGSIPALFSANNPITTADTGFPGSLSIVYTLNNSNLTSIKLSGLTAVKYNY
jgi:hypothetical protein